MNQIFNLKNIFLLLFSITFFSCSTSPKFTKDEQDIQGKNRYKNVHAVYQETVIGNASYYAEIFHNKITYSGEVYDMYGLSAAHTTYRMGTKILVTNLENGQSVELIVNDKFPKHPTRILDLSYGAAKALGMLKDGVVKVRIDVIEWGAGRE